MTFIIEDISQLSKVTAHLIGIMDKYKIFLLTGDLGAGKTTLVKQWMKDLGVTDPVSSPTFSIINEYHGPDQIIYHMDMYRLDTLDEAYNIGIEEYLYDSGQYSIIEWPELVRSLIEPPYIDVNIGVDNETRSIRINQQDESM